MDNFFKKYEVALWMCVVSIWCFLGLIVQDDITTFAISGGICWAVLAVIEFIQIKTKNKSGKR